MGVTAAVCLCDRRRREIPGRTSWFCLVLLLVKTDGSTTYVGFFLAAVVVDVVVAPHPFRSRGKAIMILRIRGCQPSTRSPLT